MICPPEDGSSEGNAQVLKLVSGLFGQEILGYIYPENGLGWGGCMGSCLGLTDFFIQQREAQPEEGLKQASECWAMAGVPLAQV